MSEVEMSYDNYLVELSNKFHGKVDVNLALKIMYLERKFPDVEPRVDVDIKTRSGINNQKMAYLIQSKFGLSTAVHGAVIFGSGRLDIENLVKLASHQDVESIHGTASAASY